MGKACWRRLALFYLPSSPHLPDGDDLFFSSLTLAKRLERITNKIVSLGITFEYVYGRGTTIFNNGVGLTRSVISFFSVSNLSQAHPSFLL